MKKLKFSILGLFLLSLGVYAQSPPTFTSVPVLTGTQGAVYTYTALATDVDVGDVLDYSAPVLPASGWLTFNPVSQILTGTPGNDDVGDNAVTIRVTDGTFIVDQSFTIVVANVNDPPTFTSVPVLTGTQGTVYTYTALATDIDVGDVLDYSAPLLPASGWLTFDPTTRILTGTPGNDDVGDNAVTIRVNDGTVDVDQSFTIVVANVNDPPTFTSVPVLSGTQGAVYTYTALAADIDAGDVLDYSAPLLPASGWLTFDPATRILTGTPGNDDVGDNAVTIRVNDGTVDVDQSFTIVVGDINDAPVFTSIPDTTAEEEVLYSYTATAIDVDGNTLTYSAPVLPSWLFFSVATHILSGTPGNDDVGDHPVTLSVFDGTVTVNQQFVIHVANVNDAPVFTSVPVISALQGTEYTYTVTAEDVDVDDTLVYSAPLLPGWLLFDIDTHILSGTPGNDDVGDNAVTIRVNDGSVDVDQSFTIVVADVNDAPTFTLVPDTVATEDVPYSSSIAASDVDAGDVLTYSAPLLPAWLLFDTGTQVLSGTPGNAEVGYHTVTLRVSDGTIDVDTTFTIHVYNVNDAPTFTSTPVTSAQQGTQYSYTATASDIDGDVLVYSAPVLPVWLTFSSTTHILRGTPGNSHVGNNNVTLRIFDGTVHVDQSFVINVSNVNDAPVFTSQPDTVARPGTAYEYTLTAIDIDGDPLTYTAPVLPQWLTFDPSTHTLSATPGEEEVGDWFVSIRVSDGSLSALQNFNITVSYGNHAPTFTSDPSTSALVGSAYIYSIKANDIDGDELIYSAPQLPDWLTFYPATNVISGIPHIEDLGQHYVTVRVSDGTVSADQNFRISVNNGNDTPTFTSAPVTTAREMVFYTYTATAEDLDDDALTYTAPQLPDWLSFNVSTHVLSGTPGYQDAGIHSVTLRVTDGIESVDQGFDITVENNPGVGIDQADSPDQVLIYPNPTNGRFKVECNREFKDDVTLEVIDAKGKVMLQQVISSQQPIREEFNLSDQPAGIYFIRIYNPSGQTLGRLIIR